MGASGSVMPLNASPPVPAANKSPEPDNFEELDYFEFFISYFEFDCLCLGSGRYGRVYKVKNKLDGGDFALKVLEIQRQCKGRKIEEATLKAIREIKILREANHPNLLRYYFSWEIKKLPPTWVPPPQFPTECPLFCIQTELCENTLRQKLYEKDELRSKPDWNVKSKEWVNALMDGLRYMHRLNMMHRDLNSNNIFFKTNPFGEEILVIGDFGMSRTWNNEQMLTTDVFCAPLYKSMEMENEEEYDHRCDVYSAGVLFYEILHPLVMIPEKPKDMDTSQKEMYLPRESICNLKLVHQDVTMYEEIEEIPEAMNDLIKRMLTVQINRPTSQMVWDQLKGMDWKSQLSKPSKT